MFLNQLNERERKNFLELADIAMNLGDDEKIAEEQVIDTFRREMDLQEYKLEGKNQEALVQAFQASTKPVKRIVMIELAGILDADEEIDAKEENWIVKLGKDLNFRDAEIKKLVRWTQDFNDLLIEGYSYINKR